MTSPSETTNENTGSKFAEHDKVTINRGKHKGETGTVIGVDPATGQYAVKLSTGFVTASGATLNAPGEASITAGRFAGVASQYAGQLPDGFLAALEQVAPGLTADVTVAVSA